MSVTPETITAAMDLVAMMAVVEVADRTGRSDSEVVAGFLASETAALLYDDDLKYWWDGPSAMADMYLAETGDADGAMEQQFLL
jgi:hypothetical protein